MIVPDTARLCTTADTIIPIHSGTFFQTSILNSGSYLQQHYSKIRFAGNVATAAAFASNTTSTTVNMLNFAF
jgi:hypothetical protein